MRDPKMDLGGVIVATTLAFKSDASAPAGLAVDYDKFGAHIDFLMSNGCRGVGPNGSLGEYSSLTDEERRKVTQVAVDAVDGRGLVIAGVHGVGWHQSQMWAEYAKQDGADGVLLLPPILYRSTHDGIVEHFRHVAEVGLPIMAYNNPFDTKVDLTPPLIARLAEIPEVVAVKEFSGDVRRVFDIK
ncbi:MAG: dihydrodipicolinate synthase family protein, partial [Mycobacterium sp.]